MRILLLSSQANFITQIASFIKQKHNDLVVVTLNEGKTINKLNRSTFDEIIRYKITRFSLFFYIRSFPKILKYSFFSALFLLLNYKQGLKSFKCLYDACGYIGKIQHAKLVNFDIINIHYLTIKKAIAILLLPSKSNVIISIWGSDLFRTSGLCYNFWIKKALEKANTIHIASFEMQTTLLSEFGYELKNKIKFAFMIPSFDQIQQIDTIRAVPDKIERFKARYQLKGKKCIMIGNNARIGNNHIEILNAIKSVVEEYKLTIILPLTYGKEDSYMQIVKEFFVWHKMNVILLTEYLSNEDLAAIKVVSDIFITMQETDAMSAFFTESLYAENICVAASWLPYSKIRQSGAYYHECSHFNELKQIIKNIIKDIDNEKQKCKNNPKLIKAAFYDKEMLLNSWENVYQL